MKGAPHPETAAEAAAWARRRADYLKSGVGGPNCLALDCASSGAYLSGAGYGHSPDACTVCALVMASWPTRPVGGTGFRHVPRGGLRLASDWQAGEPGVSGYPHAACHPSASAAQRRADVGAA